MMHVRLAWRWHLGSPAPLCEWLFFDRSGVEHLNCAAVHHRLRFGDKVLALIHRSDFPERDQAHDARSEEHTSELQSLMRISYAVFCLKKKKEKQNNKM